MRMLQLQKIEYNLQVKIASLQTQLNKLLSERDKRRAKADYTWNAQVYYWDAIETLEAQLKLLQSLYDA